MGDPVEEGRLLPALVPLDQRPVGAPNLEDLLALHCVAQHLDLGRVDPTLTQHVVECDPCRTDLPVQTLDMVDSVPEPELAVFCRQVRARSAELQEAMPMVAARGLDSIAVGFLRQELDSLVRVMFLLAQSDRVERARLVADAVNGVPWRTRTASEMGPGDRRIDGEDRERIQRMGAKRLSLRVRCDSPVEPARSSGTRSVPVARDRGS